MRLDVFCHDRIDLTRELLDLLVKRDIDLRGIEIVAAGRIYLTGYYTVIRPHRHNNGLPPDEAERIYYDNVRKSVTCFS